jgi:hypothetical protein
MKHVVGYGCKSFGFGSFGISVSISMFICSKKDTPHLATSYYHPPQQAQGEKESHT